MVPNKRRKISKEEEDKEQKKNKPSSTTFYTPLTLIHRVGRGKDLSAHRDLGHILLLRIQHGSQQRPLYVVPSQTRPKPKVVLNDEDDEEDEDEEDEDEDEEDKEERKLVYEIEKQTRVSTTFSTTGLRIAARALHNKDISSPRFYFEQEPLLKFDEKKSLVKDRDLQRIDDARIFRVEDEAKPTLYVRCKWSKVADLPPPQTRFTWEPLEALSFVEEWRVLFESFLCGSPSTDFPLVRTPELVADLHLSRSAVFQFPSLSHL